jgi:hypothetical protein
MRARRARVTINSNAPTRHQQAETHLHHIYIFCECVCKASPDGQCCRRHRHTGNSLAGILGALERLQAALAGPSGPNSAHSYAELEHRRPVALCLPICPRQRRRLDVPERRAQTSAAGRAARAHGAAVGAQGFEAAVRSAAGLCSAGWPSSSPWTALFVRTIRGQPATN